jgi:hypothetical protein
MDSNGDGNSAEGNTKRNVGCNAWNIFCNNDNDNEHEHEKDNDNTTHQNNPETDVQKVAQHFQVRVDVHDLQLEDDHHYKNQNKNQNRRTSTVQSSKLQSNSKSNPNLNYRYNQEDEYTYHSRASASASAMGGSIISISSNDHDNDHDHDNDNDEHRKMELMVLTRSALSRPFGRTSLPAHLAKTFVVEVTSLGYEERRGECECGCVYNIMAQMEDYSSGTPAPSPIRNELSMSSSFVAVNVNRTLRDFMWLEEALRDEFHGSLLFPVLSLALTSGTDWTTSPDGIFDKESFERGEWDPVTMSVEILEGAIRSREPVDTKLIADWLSDVLNAVRGKGELILSHKMVDIVHSEAMETFLYKTAGPLPSPRQRQGGRGLPAGESGGGILNWDFKALQQFQEEEDGDGGFQSTLASLFKANLKCLGISGDECEWPTDDLGSDSNSPIPVHHSDVILSRRNRIHKRRETPKMWQNMIQSDSLRAQRF